jgi:DNA-binding transcriptional regulator YhcF (GntR family)
MDMQGDTPSPFPICRPLAEPLPSSRELVGFVEPNTLTRAMEDLKRSGYRPLHAGSGCLRPRESESEVERTDLAAIAEAT